MIRPNVRPHGQVRQTFPQHLSLTFCRKSLFGKGGFRPER